MSRARSLADLANENLLTALLATTRIGIGTTDPSATLEVSGDARVTGIMTVGSSSLTFDGDSNVVNVGTALTLGHTQGVQFHTQNLHSTGFEVNNVNASGIVTATSFVGDGSNLTGLQAGYFEKTDVGIHTLSNIGIGTTNPTSALTVSGNIAVTGTVDGRDVATDGTKLDGIESNATADQTAAEILTAIKTVDGVSSGLNADQLDNLEGSQFLRSDTSATFTGTAFTLKPTNYTRFVESDVASNYIDITVETLNGVARNEVEFTGTLLFRSNAGYDSIGITTEGILQYSSDGSTWYNFLHAGSSGLNADTLGGISSTSFLRSDQNDTKTSGYLRFNDNIQLQIGTGDDLTIRSNGTHSYFDVPSGADIFFTEADVNRFTFDMGAGNFLTQGSITSSTSIAAATGITVNNNTVWHAGNDGSGSGLDADTVDSIEGANICTLNGDQTISGRKVFTSSGSGGSSSGFVIESNAQYHLAMKGVGTGNSPLITFWEGGVSTFKCQIGWSSNGYIRLDNNETNDELRIGNTLDYVQGTTSYEVWHEGNHGATSGLDADLLDGQEGSYYLDTSSGAQTKSGNLRLIGTPTSDPGRALTIWQSGTTGIYIRNTQASVGFSLVEEGTSFKIKRTYSANSESEGLTLTGSADLIIYGKVGLGGTNYGTSGQVLTSNGSGSAPTWQNSSGGGDITPDSVTINSISKLDVISTTLSTTTQTAIASIAAATYRSVEFMIQATQGTSYHTIKVLALHDGTTAYNSQYGEIFTVGSLATFDVDISNGNIRLLATGASANSTTYKVSYTTIVV